VRSPLAGLAAGAFFLALLVCLWFLLSNLQQPLRPARYFFALLAVTGLGVGLTLFAPR
jgi:HAMP domain-containing protein